MKMSEERKLSGEAKASAIATAKALERPKTLIGRQTRPSAMDRRKPKHQMARATIKLDEETFTEYHARMRAAGELLGHRKPSEEERREAEGIVDDLAEDIVDDAASRPRVRRKPTRRNR